MLVSLSKPFALFYSLFFLIHTFYLTPFFSKLKPLTIRNYILIIASLTFLTLLANAALASLLITLVLGIFCFYSDRIKLINKGPWPLIILVLIFFINKLLKVTSSADFLVLLGFSYTMFKMIHFSVDQKAGLIKEKSLLIFINYLFYFPTYISGPIVRYQDFHHQMQSTQSLIAYGSDLNKGIKRLILGLFKLVVVSKYISPFTFFNLNQEFIFNSSLFWQIIYSHAGLIYLYLNFSGYCDLAIGLSRMIGIKIPENFDYPFLARNLQIFWKHWHITLSEWLRTYVFFPLYKALITKDKKQEFLIPITAFSFFITFFVMGICDGLSFNFFIHGVLLGLGTTIAYLWSTLIKKLGVLKQYNSSKMIKAMAIIITFHYFSFCVLLFDANSNEKLQFLYKVIISHVTK